MQWYQHLHVLQHSNTQDHAGRYNYKWIFRQSLLRKSFPASDLGKQNSTQRKLERILAVIKSWMDTMRLRLNTNKMECITFGSKAQLLKIPKKPLTTGNYTIQMSSDVKCLGRTLDSQLSFNKDITMKIWKVMSNFKCIKVIWKYLTKQACTILVLSLCITHLDYGNALLYGLPKSHKETTNSSKHVPNLYCNA